MPSTIVIFMRLCEEIVRAKLADHSMGSALTNLSHTIVI